MANNSFVQPIIGYGNGTDRSNQQIPIQYPYNNNNNNLMMNIPYNNYIGGNSNSFNQNQQYLKCRPVSSREEAMASQIDLDGSLWVFTDINNGKIYTKQINNDGTASFNTYTYIKEEIPYQNPSDFVTKDEFNKVIQSLMAAINPSQQNTETAQNNINNNKSIIF